MYALRNLTSCVFFIKCEILVRNISDPILGVLLPNFHVL